MELHKLYIFKKHFNFRFLTLETNITQAQYPISHLLMLSALINSILDEIFLLDKS